MATRLGDVGMSVSPLPTTTDVPTLVAEVEPADPITDEADIKQVRVYTEPVTTKKKKIKR